jgi:hypothetical protein
MKLVKDKQYIVNVYSTTDQRGTIIACGKLVD